jgi:multidrug resistance efflux pump
MTEQLAESATDINTLFHRDPMEMTDDDISSIIAEYRRKRHLFQSGAPSKATAAKAKTAGQTAATKLNLDIDLKL